MVDIKDLKKINFMKGLPDDTLGQIAKVAQMEAFEEESILISQDETPHLIYMLVGGRIFLNCRASNARVLTLDELIPGQTFGVSALLDNSPATYTAICAEKSTLITLASDQLLALFETDYTIGYEMMKRVVEKFKIRTAKHTEQFLASLANHPDVKGLA